MLGCLWEVRRWFGVRVRGVSALGGAVDLGDVTKIDFLFDDGTLVTNSTATDFPIKWDPSETLVIGKIICRLGDEDIGVGNRVGKLITYDPGNPDGIVWSGKNGIAFHVIAEDVGP